MEALKQLESLFLAKISVFKTFCSLVQLEARLARISVLPLLLNLCMLFIVLITVWLSTMFLIGYFVLLISNRFIFSLLFVLVLNLGLLLALVKYLSFNLKSMSFQKTREYLLHKSIDYEQLEKADHSANCNDGQNTASSEKQGDRI
jgi:uncharacterized membrane protein YqjE